MAQAFADPQVLARGLVIKQPVAHINKALVATDRVAPSVNIHTVASPLRLTATPPVLHRAPPRLGEHTDEVLAALGLDLPTIEGLRARSVV